MKKRLRKKIMKKAFIRAGIHAMRMGIDFGKDEGFTTNTLSVLEKPLSINSLRIAQKILEKELRIKSIERLVELQRFMNFQILTFPQGLHLINNVSA